MDKGHRKHVKIVETACQSVVTGIRKVKLASVLEHVARKLVSVWVVLLVCKKCASNRSRIITNRSLSELGHTEGLSE